MILCPNCHGLRTIGGRLATGAKSEAVFRLARIRSFTLSLYGGPRINRDAYACLDCGCIWSATLPEPLRQFVEKKCSHGVSGPAPPCPKCNCPRTVVGRIVDTRRLSTFEPDRMRFGLVRFLIGGIWLRGKAFACTECGLVWTVLPPERVRQFIATYCD
jgi:hypothetical protein